MDASGNVRFIQRQRRREDIEYTEYLKLLDNPNVKVERMGYVMTPTGNQLVEVYVTEEIHSWKGEHATGNLETGIFDLGPFSGRYDKVFIKAEHAQRTPKGRIDITSPKISTCEYLEDHHEHYSLTATSVSVWPEQDREDMRYLKDTDNYSMLVYNPVLKVFGIPIFYFPIMYKPAWDSGLGVGVRMGSNSDWGYFLQLKKSFSIWDYPNTKATLFADFYSKRGIGGGLGVRSYTHDSKTDFFMYGIHDTGVDKRKARMKFDSNRYDLWVSHVNHLTPRLDVRGRFEKLSDIEFLHDFFRKREDIDPQPATFGAIEYQFDRLSVSAYVRPRVNNFFTVVERLPEIRLDAPRQELFKNIYYQGEMSFSYLRQRWRKFDYPRAAGGADLKNYESMRFDSLNMFYYPFSFMDINLIPRAGVRLTAYSRSSKTKIDTDQLYENAKVDYPHVDNAGNVVNYDSKGGARFRVVPEVGIEINTKIHRVWQDVKSAFWEIDGLRHVMVPYMNYNFIPQPNVDRDKLYYFDDIDRIEEQNFIRIGVKNRLQTRRGAYGAQEIYNWMTLENYMDFHFDNSQGDGVGNFGTLFAFQPFPDLSVNADLLINIGSGGVSRFSPNIEYKINEDWRVYGGYYYQNEYTERAAYSMGSSLSDITSGTAFEKKYGRNHSIYGGIDFPLIDDKTKGSTSINYNFEAGMLDEARFGITRLLHCWEVGVEYRLRQRNDDMAESMWEHQIMFTLGLTAYPKFKIEAKQEVGGANE